MKEEHGSKAYRIHDYGIYLFNSALPAHCVVRIITRLSLGRSFETSDRPPLLWDIYRDKDKQ